MAIMKQKKRTQATINYTDHAGQQQTRNLTIDEATRDMGINPIALIWERSALVLVLIFMSGWFRDEKTHEDAPVITPATQPVAPPVSSISETDMQRILSALAEVASLKDEVRQLRTVSVQEVATPVNPQLPEHAESVNPLQNAPSDTDDKPMQGLQSYEEIIADLFRDNPQIGDQEAAERAGCSRTTAAKWLKRVRP